MTENRGLSPDRYAVMGNPVAHSKSPRIHTAFAQQTSQALTYEALLVPVEQFEQAVLAFRESGGKGLNITLPFKEQAWKLAGMQTVRATLAGAVNTLWFSADGHIHGDNTDGAGLLRDLEHHSMPVSGSRILILGAGGAVRGVTAPLLEQNPAEVIIANRTLSKAQELVERHQTGQHAIRACRLEDLAELGSFDLIINALSSGLRGELPPLPKSLIAKVCHCYDMVYGDTETPFVSWAKSAGASCAVDGLGMLVEQAAESFYIWRGVRPHTKPVIEMLRKASLVAGR